MFRFLLLLSVALLSSCAATPEEQKFDAMLTAPHVYTLTNLHPQDRRSIVYTMNYQMDGLIPVCTEVKLLQRAYGYLEFQTIDSGRIYTYQEHGNPGEEFVNHISKYFGTDCDETKIKALRDIDQKGIFDGKALVGMSRQGVIYALGYPPVSKTPHLENNRWWYWKTRFNRFYVEFDHTGAVVNIKD